MSRKDSPNERGDLVCEAQSSRAYRAESVVVALVVVGFWGFLVFFYLGLATIYGRGETPSVSGPVYLILWTIATLGLTAYALREFRKARVRVFAEGFVLPRKQGLAGEVFVSFAEIESTFDVSEHETEMSWKRKSYTLARRQYGSCFDSLRTKLREQSLLSAKGLWASRSSDWSPSSPRRPEDRPAGMETPSDAWDR